MSVLINMEMPQTCFKCKVSRITPSMYAFCLLNEKCYPADETPPSDCPLVSVPPHGRLIDADALYTELAKRKSYGELSAKSALRAVANAPTIIQASGKDTDVPTREEGE